MTYRILGLVDSTTDAMAYYRSSLPWIRITQHYPDVSVDFISPNTNPNWDLLSQYNVLFSQRPDSRLDVDFINKCKVHRMKIWVDFDDALWAVTSDSPAFLHYNNTATREAVKECIESADVITVSTQELADSLYRFSGKEANVIENAVDLYGMQYISHYKKDADTLIWRGSHTHQNDLLSVKEDLMKIDNEFDLRWTFMGLNFWLVTESLREVTHIDYIAEQTLYYETLRKIEGNMMYVPLVDNEFNRCKSKIAALEAIVCGLIPLVPLWWEDMNLFGEGTYYERLKRMLQTPLDTRQVMHRNLVKLVIDNYNLEDKNIQRVDILRTL